MPVATFFIRGLLVLLLFLARPLEIPAADPVKIASIYAFSGVAAESNRPSYEGVRYGVTEINQRGGILGRSVELIEIDNRSTPIGAKVAARRAVEADVTAVIGASWSSHSLAIAKVVQPEGIIMITTDSTNPQVTLVGDYIFRVCYTDTFQGQVMARFARDRLTAGNALVFINVASDYSMGLAQAFTDSFLDAGGTVLKSIHYKGNRPILLLRLERTRWLSRFTIVSIRPLRLHAHLIPMAPGNLPVPLFPPSLPK